MGNSNKKKGMGVFIFEKAEFRAQTMRTKRGMMKCSPNLFCLITFPAPGWYWSLSGLRTISLSISLSGIKDQV